MSNEINPKKIILPLTLLIAVSGCLRAQTAPRPAQLAAAKTVFISNVTMHEGSSNDEFYDTFYADVGALNRFSSVAAPAQADLVVEFTGVPGLFTLRILDPRSAVVLWSMREEYNAGGRAATILRNEHKALLNLAGDLKQICLPTQ